MPVNDAAVTGNSAMIDAFDHAIAHPIGMYPVSAYEYSKQAQKHFH